MNDSMHINDIPNSMIYDLVTKLDTKIDASTSRLEAKIDALEVKLDNSVTRLDAKIDNSTARLEAKIDTLETKVDASTFRLEAKIDKNTELINQIYQRGDKLELSFSRKVLLGNSALAGIVSFFVALFTGRMMIEN